MNGHLFGKVIIGGGLLPYPGGGGSAKVVKMPYCFFGVLKRVKNGFKMAKKHIEIFIFRKKCHTWGGGVGGGDGKRPYFFPFLFWNPSLIIFPSRFVLLLIHKVFPSSSSLVVSSSYAHPDDDLKQAHDKRMCVEPDGAECWCAGAGVSSGGDASRDEQAPRDGRGTVLKSEVLQQLIFPRE